MNGNTPPPLPAVGAAVGNASDTASDTAEQRRLERQRRREELTLALGESSARPPKPTATPTTAANGTSNKQTEDITFTEKAGNWLRNQPTPGGVAALVAGLIVLGILIIPVTMSDGTHTTRGMLLLGTITGGVKITPPNTGSGTGTGVGSGGGGQSKAASQYQARQVPIEMPAETPTSNGITADTILDPVGWSPLLP